MVVSRTGTLGRTNRYTGTNQQVLWGGQTGILGRTDRLGNNTNKSAPHALQEPGRALFLRPCHWQIDDA